MERILKNERRVEGDCKRYLLRYTLVSNGFPKEEGEGIYYGIITEQFVWTDEGGRWEAQDTAQVKGFSESLEESMAFFEKMVQGEVMPVSLNEIVDDWKVRFIWEGKNRHKISFIVNLVSIVLCHICFLCRIG